MQYSKFLLISCVSGLIVGTSCLAQAVPAWQKNYNAEKIAAAETAMWQAYYNKNQMTGKIKLGMLMIELLKKQFGMNSSAATQTAYMMTSSAMRLRDVDKTKTDWKQVEKLLLQSYQALQSGFEKRRLAN